MRAIKKYFKSKAQFINVDINGSLNIMRKYDNYKNLPRPDACTSRRRSLRPVRIEVMRLVTTNSLLAYATKIRNSEKILQGY